VGTAKAKVAEAKARALKRAVEAETAALDDEPDPEVGDSRGW
jgi:hypothetical protein